MDFAFGGVAPECGFNNEPFAGKRANRSGAQLFGGYRFAYFGRKADYKARRESHQFSRHYGCNLICEECMASRPKANPALSFKDFSANAPHLLTHLSHSDYVRTATAVTAWNQMKGFHYKTVFRDPMHTVFLGTAKEVLASCVGYWARQRYLVGATLHEQLRHLSRKQRSDCKAAGLTGFSKR